MNTPTIVERQGRFLPSSVHLMTPTPLVYQTLSKVPLHAGARRFWSDSTWSTKCIFI